ncbi:shikimate dehydrogenase [Erythrobacter crassostreae]|uniref:Shikimate dehydrogenase (NADP(+)) n=1 Tax=Erythrobacter crassostreae TaxID=2828328 RepID=A0A9X1JNM7_9SPHN|nr:shikimate dehydrogenase [Erythrobacter crassostrea]MBV7258577.1 shikimate dehydrogenase [Erythrobacter crassostrea]
MNMPYAHVIGDPIAQSKSPLIHGFWLEKLGIAGRYKARHVEDGGLRDYLSKYREDGSWIGCNVTMPHKQSIISEIDALDPVAETLGAVNTVVRHENGVLKGFNTDAEGFLEPLKPLLEAEHLFRMARIIGTGGAARAIIAALADNGFTLVVAGRNPSKARALLDELAPRGEHHAIDLSYFAEPTDFPFDDRDRCLDLVINASPLGMEGNPPLAFDWSHAPPGSIAYDIVTNPLETPFLRSAREAGCPTIGGLAMLIGQAAAAFEKFFGAQPPREYDAELQGLLTK